MRRDSLVHTIRVALLLCLACSLVVSAAAVGLRSFQRENKQRELRRNVLLAAGLFDPARHTLGDIEPLFSQVQPLAVDLDTGEVIAEGAFLERLAEARVAIANPLEYEPARAARYERLSVHLTGGEDVAGIRRREQYSLVYRVDEGGPNDMIVLPVRGYGLWSTLHGFLAIDVNSLKQGPQHAEVRGLTFYDHGETPGLGGEVDNPVWQARWEGLHLFDEDWNVIAQVTKTVVDPERQVDALSGATITSNGVTNMLRFWLGDRGFGPFLRTLAASEDRADES